MKPLLALLLSLTSLLVVARGDDRRDHDDRGRGRVILFEHANYSGGALVLYPGDEIDNFSGKTFDNGTKLNDGVSSIRVEGNAEVFVYDNARFRGNALRLTESVRDLNSRYVSGGVGTTWNDRVSSIKVTREANYRPEPPRVDPEKIIRIAFKDQLGRDPGAGELREIRGRFIEGGWNERMLRDYLRTDDRYRSETTNFIIRQAYLDVLGREPDAGGLNSYRKKVLEKGWTENDVRDDLRKSAEYRNRPRK